MGTNPSLLAIRRRRSENTGGEISRAIAVVALGRAVFGRAVFGRAVFGRAVFGRGVTSALDSNDLNAWVSDMFDAVGAFLIGTGFFGSVASISAGRVTLLATALGGLVRGTA
jgi:hypothetical protein